MSFSLCIVCAVAQEKIKLYELQKKIFFGGLNIWTKLGDFYGGVC